MQTEIINSASENVAEATANTHSNPDIKANAPGEIRVIRRNGKITPFDASKI